MRRRPQDGMLAGLRRDGHADRSGALPRHVVGGAVVAAIGDPGNGEVRGIDQGERGSDDEQQDQEKPSGEAERGAHGVTAVPGGGSSERCGSRTPSDGGRVVRTSGHRALSPPGRHPESLTTGVLNSLGRRGSDRHSCYPGLP